MLKSIYRFDETKASFKTWLYKIASNKIILSYRSTYYKYVTVVEEVEELAIGYENSLERSVQLKEDINEILEIVNRFNAHTQQIFRLKVFGEMTFAEISSLLDISESTAKTRYYSAIKKIKRYWRWRRMDNKDNDFMEFLEVDLDLSEIEVPEINLNNLETIVSKRGDY